MNHFPLMKPKPKFYACTHIALLLSACGGGEEAATSSSGNTQLLANASISTGATLPSTAHHLYVAPDGSDNNPGTQSAPFKTIQKASEVVVPDSTVHVAPGTYVGGITTSTSGSADGRIYFISDKKWGARIVPPSSGGTLRAWIVSGNYVTLHGFEIDGSKVPASGPSWRIGILTRSSNVLLENNYIHHIANREADCTSIGGGGIVADSYYGGKTFNAERNLIHAIGPAACRYIHGIYMSTSGTVANNVIYKVGHGGVHLWHDANRVNIVNNTIFDVPRAIIVGTGQRYHLDAPGDYTNVANNILVDNDYGIIEESDGKGYGSHNYYVNNLHFRNKVNEAIYPVNRPHVAGSIMADPQFVNYQIDGDGDYRLKSGSPAIGKGSSSHTTALDFQGKKRVNGDVGAYEN